MSESPVRVQDIDELNRFYAESSDPWNYDATPDDMERRGRLLSLLPPRQFRRVLDIGCGNGFLTHALPGDHVIGTDISEAAIGWARKRTQDQPNQSRFEFHTLSLFDLTLESIGQFDLIVVTGVLYPQYIGKSSSLVQIVIDRLLCEKSVLVSCHINDWCGMRFPYALIDMSYYDYRSYSHRLEVYQK